MTTQTLNNKDCLSLGGALPSAHHETVLRLVDALDQGRSPNELGARKLRARKGGWRFRIGRKHRLLVWERGGKRQLEVVTRQALESAIARR